jgi:hypothetical protein
MEQKVDTQEDDFFLLNREQDVTGHQAKALIKSLKIFSSSKVNELDLFLDLCSIVAGFLNPSKYSLVSKKDSFQSTVLERDAKISRVLACMSPLSGPIYLDADCTAIAAIVDYLTHHKGIQPEIIPPKPRDPWDAEFVDEFENRIKILCDMMGLATYLDIHSLWQLCCGKMASLIKALPLADIQAILAA